MFTSSRPVSAALAACLLLSLSSASAYAATTREELERARQLIDEAEFEAALELINDELDQPGNSQEMLAQLYQLQGITYLYLGNEASARQSFERLLAASPAHELPKGSSPKVRQLFDSVRADLRTRQAKSAGLAHEPVRAAPAGERFDVRASLDSAPPGGQLQLHFRREGRQAWSTTRMQPAAGGNEWIGYVPAFELPAEGAPYSLDYYLELVDATGTRLTGAGSAEQPFTVEIGVPGTLPGPVVEASPIYTRWWFWTIAGGVAAGAAVGAAFLVPVLLDDTATVPVTIRVQP